MFTCRHIVLNSLVLISLLSRVKTTSRMSGMSSSMFFPLHCRIITSNNFAAWHSGSSPGSASKSNLMNYSRKREFSYERLCSRYISIFFMKWGCKGHWGHWGWWGCWSHWGHWSSWYQGNHLLHKGQAVILTNKA